MGYLFLPGAKASDDSPDASSHIAKSIRVGLAALAVAIASTLAVASPVAAGEVTTILEGNHPDQAAEIAESEAAPTRPLAMRLTMAIRNRAELDRMLADQQDPASAEYHHWLTPDEFTNRFGPTDADLAKVTRWLTRKGFAVQSADPRTRVVTFTGTVASAETAFGVKIAATADASMFANTADPTVPADVAPLIESIRGLDNLLHSAPNLHRVPMPAPDASAPNARINGKTGFGPNDLHTFYDQPPDFDGTGSDCIAIIEDSDFNRSAADAFNSDFGLPPFTGANFEVVLPDGSNPGINGDGDETMVDVNYSHAMAPGAPLRVYIGDPTHSTTPLPDAIARAVTDNACAAITVSFSFCGTSNNFFKAENSRFAQAASQGQAVFVATGDIGAAALIVDKKHQRCAPGTKRGVNELAASPNASAIGGTEFTPNLDSNGDDVGSVSESTWNDGAGATGGGKSKIFKKPAFQKGLFKKDKKRDLPDISFGASPNSPGFFFGDPATEAFLIGGTSIGAPAWAGISELLSQRNGTTRIGNLNARLYQLGVTGGSNGIRDVTSGDNGFNGVPGFSALPGFDKATGWGTVDIGVFVPAFVGK